MRYILALVFAAALFSSCSPSKEDATKAIKQAEDNLYANDGAFMFNDSLATITLDAYMNYVNSFPEDSASADYLFKVAELQRAKKQYAEAVATFGKVAEQYPSFEKVPHTVFLQGFIYENDLQDMDKARERYEYFVKTYPKHPLARDVQFSLNNLGKSPEQIIREFEEKNGIGQDSLSSSTVVDSTVKQ